MCSNNRSLRVGVALMAAGGLLLELSLLRVLSALYAHSYVYVILSIALLGNGLGAAMAIVRPPQVLASWVIAAGAAAFLLAPLLPWAAVRGWVWLVVLLALIPYMCVGAAVATAFWQASQQSAQLYWADLTGAALAALGVIPLLNRWGPLGGVVVAGCVLSMAGLALGGRWLAGGGIIVGLALLSLVNERVDIDYARMATKPISHQLNAGGEVVSTRWDSFARTDLVWRPDQGAYYVYIDGGAGSLIPPAGLPERWQQDISRFPLVADPPQRVFIIGPGGGLDIALVQAFSETLPDVIAAELNAASIALTRELVEYAGELYSDAITIAVDEGRSALRRSGQFDLILLSQVVAQAAEARALALSENSVYTVEAFHDYLDHLTPEGQIALKLYDELTLTRAMFTAMQALRERGLSSAAAAQHLLALLDTRASPPIPLLVVYRTPLTPEVAIQRARVAERLGLALLHVPGLWVQPPLQALMAGMVELEQLVAEAMPLDVRPARDARPFFFHFERGVPQSLQWLIWGVALLSILLLTLSRLKGPWGAPPGLPVTFSLLGIGFMTIEIVVLQHSRLFIGHPSLNLSVVLVTLLFGAGLGSALSAHVAPQRILAAASTAALAVALTFAIWLAVWPPLSAMTLHFNLVMRAVVVAASVLPLALVLGMPFPLMLRWAGCRGRGAVAWGWALSGVMSVMGAVSATAIALLWGFAAVAGVGLASYTALGVWLPLRRWRVA